MSTKILLVDDEPDLEDLVRKKFRRKITQKEIELHYAENGVRALEILTAMPDVDIVLTDINMPQMDGLVLLSKIRDLQNPLLKAVVISAYDDMINIRTAMNRGAFDFITKPISFDDLEKTIERTCEEIVLLKQALTARDQLTALRQELNIACKIQNSILPQAFPYYTDRSEFEIYAKMLSATEVGGDFYDFFLLDEKRLGFLIGDVSGKGVPAAIFMAASRTLFKAVAMRGLPPEQCIAEVNQALCRESPANMFVTAFYGILDTRSGEITYCNAGHNDTYILRPTGSVDTLDLIGGIPLGFINTHVYQSHRVTITPGDMVFIYTDGVNEAMDAAENEYTEQRLKTCLEMLVANSLPQILDGVVQSVKSFTGDHPMSDDVTMLILKYLGAKP